MKTFYVNVIESSCITLEVKAFDYKEARARASKRVFDPDIRDRLFKVCEIDYEVMEKPDSVVKIDV